MVPFDAATLYLLDPERKQYQERAVVNDRVDLLSFLKIGQGEGLAGCVSAIQKPLLLAERNTSELFNPKTDYATVLAVPLVNNNAVIGVVGLGCRATRALSDKHVRLMTVIADQLAVSVERRQYERTITRQHKELEEAHQRLKAAQQKLIAQEKLAIVAELAATVNHEINNPLAIVIGNVQCMLVENTSMTQKALSRLQRIEEAAIRIAETNRKLVNINQLVSESYLGNGERRLNLDKSTVK
jgi:signal transduction protein with GAF and PtsI domain